jgi:beta-glucanase (GH16 family)
VTPKSIAMVGCLAAFSPAFAQEEHPAGRTRLSLPVASDPAGEKCRAFDASHPHFVTAYMHRTFHDDFNEHPLSRGKWVPHYAGGVAYPEARYWGGEGSDFKRKTNWNGEQQIYVDPRYAGRGTTPLGLDPFKISNGILSIVASRTPPELKPALFDNEYISGVLTTQGVFAQKYGYFEIRAKVPVGIGVWPAFWMLADDGGWPPEIDILEGRGQRPDTVAMTTHWRSPETGLVNSCGFDFTVAGAPTEFHDYGALWLPDRITYYIDRKPVADIKVPPGYNAPAYMIVNLAMGAKHFAGVGFVTAESPAVVVFEIDRISAYQIDP